MIRKLFLAIYLSIAVLASASVYAENKPFITRWNGVKGKELKIPIFGTNYTLVIKKVSDNTVLKRGFCLEYIV